MEMWRELIAELLSTGMTQAEVGNAVGFSQNTISSLLNGAIKDPGFSRGARLVALHQERCPESAAKFALGRVANES